MPRHVCSPVVQALPANSVARIQTGYTHRQLAWEFLRSAQSINVCCGWMSSIMNEKHRDVQRGWTESLACRTFNNLHGKMTESGKKPVTCYRWGYSTPSAFRCQALQSHMCGYCRGGLFPFKAQVFRSVLTLSVSSYHKQTHIASPPEPPITSLLSCRLCYVRLHNTRSVWVIFHNLGVQLHRHYRQIPLGGGFKGAGQVWQSKSQIWKQIWASWRLRGDLSLRNPFLCL